MAKDYQKKYEDKYKKMDPYERMIAMNNVANFYGVGGKMGAGEGETGRATPADRNPFAQNPQDRYRSIHDEMVKSGAFDGAMYGSLEMPDANDPAGLYAYHKSMEKDHKKNKDGNTGGAFNHLSDVQAFKARSHQAYMDKFKEDILASMPEKEQPSEQTPGALKPDPVLSERMQESQNFVNQYKLNLKNGNITAMVTGNRPSDAIFDTRPQELGSEMSDMPAGTGAEDIKQDSPLDNTASQVFSDKYKLGLKDTMKKNGMPTRGPGLVATMQIPTMGMM